MSLLLLCPGIYIIVANFGVCKEVYDENVGVDIEKLRRSFIAEVREQGSVPAIDPLHPDQESAILLVEANLSISFDRLPELLREEIYHEQQALASDLWGEVLVIHVRHFGQHEFWPIRVEDAAANVRLT